MKLKDLNKIIVDCYVSIINQYGDIIITSTCNEKDWNNFIDKYENLKVICITAQSVFKDYAEIIIQLNFNESED